jgi:hypothetical protein
VPGWPPDSDFQAYFLTVIFSFTVLPLALEEVTLKVSLTLPGFFSLSLSLTVLVLPAAIFPTFFFAFAPLPLTWSLTPVASALPELETLTL